MSNDKPNTERLVPKGETPEGALRIERRSATQAALQALETVATGAEYTLGALAATGAAMKIKGALGSNGNDSKSSSDSKD